MPPYHPFHATSYGNGLLTKCFYYTPNGCPNSYGWRSQADNGAANGWRVDPYATFDNCLTERANAWQSTCGALAFTQLATTNTQAADQHASASPPSPISPPLPPPPPPTTFYIRGSRSQIVFGTNDECTLELTSGATSLTSSCPINTPSSRRLEDTSNDSDGIAQLETRIVQLETDKAEMKEQIQFLTSELKMLKEQRKAP